MATPSRVNRNNVRRPVGGARVPASPPRFLRSGDPTTTMASLIDAVGTEVVCKLILFTLGYAARKALPGATAQLKQLAAWAAEAFGSSTKGSPQKVTVAEIKQALVEGGATPTQASTVSGGVVDAITNSDGRQSTRR